MNFPLVKITDYQVFESSKFEPYRFDINFLKQAYRRLLVPRLFEEKMLLLLRQGKISKWFSGIGQEAIEVGACLALDPEDYVVTIHRNLAAFLTRDVPIDRLFAQFQGKQSGYTNGRDRSYYCGCPEQKVIGTISHLGSQFPIADGIALANKLKGTNEITLVFTGEGGVSEGDFHEAVNLAAVWKLPVLFVIENNGYALSTPTSQQYNAKNLSQLANGYGIPGYTIDGNNVLEVYETTSKLLKNIRKGEGPAILECMTFRMRGHEEASGNKYVPSELQEFWQLKDPILQFERSLLIRGIINSEHISNLRDEVRLEVDAAIEKVLNEPDIQAQTAIELDDVYAPTPTVISPDTETSEKRFVDAIRDGLDQAMENIPNLVLIGQDIAEYGGAFKATENLLNKYGSDRVRNSPVCESALVGTALGLAIAGYKSVVEMQFSDFASCGFNQIVNNLAKIHYRWGQPADVVIRMPCGAGSAAGPFHSQSTEAWFMHTPGLKIVYPSTAADAKGLLLASILDPNPVLFFEHKRLYRSVSDLVPDSLYTIEFGAARLVKEGEDFTIITYGLGVIWAQTFQSQHPELSIRILDLRTLVPLDYASIRESVAVTSRVIVLHEANSFAGAGAEIAAWISQHCYYDLDAPVIRCAGLNTPVPFAKPLEDNFLADSRLAEAVSELLSY